MKRREFIVGLGSAAAWPLVARAQQPAMPVIGFLHQSTPAGYAQFVAAFHQGLGESGYVEGRNLAIEYRWAENHLDRLPAMATDLVRRRVAVIATAATPAALAAKAATATIPIVFTSGVDPIKSGLVASFNRPGGNVTGTVQFNASLNTKRLELLREVVPNAGVIGFLVDTDNPATATYLAGVQEAAHSIGQQIRVLSAASQEQFDEAFTTVRRERIGALVVANSTLFTDGRERLVALAARQAVPAIYAFREFVAPRGLMSYGSSNVDSYRQIGVWTDLALTGESFRLNAVIDPIIPVELAPRVVELCLAGADPRDPYASPLYGELSGLPPTLVGSDEVLRDDAVRMADKMRIAGCAVEIEVWQHMWHAWQMLMRVMPEARAAIARIATFTQDKW